LVKWGNGTNISAFIALPGGWRFGDFSGVGEYAYWLCSEGPTSILKYDSDLLGISAYYIAYEAGYSVR
jgi:hypothetical protein